MRLDKAIIIIRDKLNNMENGVVCVNGVKNISYADLELTLVYIDALKRHDMGLMNPVGKVKEVLDSFNIVYKNYNIFG